MISRYVEHFQPSEIMVMLKDSKLVLYPHQVLSSTNIYGRSYNSRLVRTLLILCSDRPAKQQTRNYERQYHRYD